jgi:XTP/dITP diphosphohydrolase
MLRLMVGEASRGAQFEAVAAFFLEGEVHISRGVCRGRLSLKASGREGFGFDPIFIPDDIEADGNPRSTSGLTFADVDLSVKEHFSHRRKALDGLIELLLTTEAASSP